ncbi:MAG: DNA mismatch repair endonuclease MutL [Methanothrix sp.]|nr:DNA mismatch repair endonuclease MutL [Methanothrix sp.]
MQKIKLLDEDTINKIAAGEVIERPASVVKELVENSIDAGATRILIEVMDGGKSLVKVTDDGCGIGQEDLSLAFQKHATSKISSAIDLSSISTLGFRGEALSSIASVAGSVEAHTKLRSALSGSYLKLVDGKVSEIKDIGCPAGTSIAVRDLFHNVPARLKYLKSASAELVRVTELVTEMAIINYNISFELFTGNRTIFKSSRSENWNDVLLKVFGLETVKRLIPFRVESRSFALTGVAGGPLCTRSSPDWIFVFVNGRPVSSRALTGGLREAYRTIIPLAKSPIAVVSLEINPSLIDVNVHPTKREIRFQNEEEITKALIDAVSEALKTKAGSEIGIGQGQTAADQPRGRIPGEVADLTIAREAEQSTFPLEIAGCRVTVDHESPEEVGPSRLRILGQVLKLYIVAESEQGLMLIDQHAAAERIRFERLRERYGQKKISQELVEAVTIELSPKEQQILESWKEVLADIGFDIDHFGGCTYNIRAVPAVGYRLESPQAIHDILSDFFSRGRIGPDSTNIEEVLKILACRGSIKSGHEMTNNEMRTLLKDLYACQNPHTCPHGRPVAVLLDEAQLERIFGRR